MNLIDNSIKASQLGFTVKHPELDNVFGVPGTDMWIKFGNPNTITCLIKE